MVSLRGFATNTDGVYGSAQHPDCLPGRDALKASRMTKAVELLVVHPSPNVSVLAAELGVSRATVYRMLADPVFQLLLQKALNGRIALIAKKALDAIERTLDEGSPGLRLRAGTWFIERLDKLRAASGGPSQEEIDRALNRAKMTELIEGIRAKSAEGSGRTPGYNSESAPLDRAARVMLAEERRSADELADAELGAADVEDPSHLASTEW